MIDMHYDLLSVIYQCFLRMDYSYIENWFNQYRDDNVVGIIANLYFMSKEEMKVELGDNYGEIDVVEMFKKSIEIYKEYNPNLKNIMFSIEGCDYINSLEELEELYNLGLRNILLVWNNKNRYGSGFKSSSGLTEEGKMFITKAVDLGISIDMSHMNKNTFFDTYNLLKDLKNQGKKVVVIASHSNSYKILPHHRNLTDEQLYCLKELDALVGAVSYINFVTEKKEDIEGAKLTFLEHINHLVEILGIDNVSIASDNMDFYRYFYNKEKINIYNYNSFKNELTLTLKQKYSEEEIEKIIYKNAYNKMFRRNEND